MFPVKVLTRKASAFRLITEFLGKILPKDFLVKGKYFNKTQIQFPEIRISMITSLKSSFVAELCKSRNNSHKGNVGRSLSTDEFVVGVEWGMSKKLCAVLNSP